MSTVRQRCLDYIEALRKSGYANEIPLESAKLLFSKVSGFYDRATTKAYFGSQPGRSIRKFQRLARYQSGTASYKLIELAQDIPHKKGYLELLGLVTIEKKGSVWFLKLNEVSIIAEMSSHNHEGSEKFIEKISLIHRSFLSRGRFGREPI